MHPTTDRTNLTVKHLRDLICLQTALGGLRQKTEANETGCTEVGPYVDELLAGTDRRVVERAGYVDDLVALLDDDLSLDDQVSFLAVYLDIDRLGR